MSWTTAGDLKAQVRRLWERGELLRSMVSASADAAPNAALIAREEAKVGLRSGCAFPLRLVLKGPASAELTERFQAVREWIAELVAVAQIRIEWREFNHRVLGVQRVPQAVWIDELDSALAMIAQSSSAARAPRCQPSAMRNAKARKPAAATP